MSSPGSTQTADGRMSYEAGHIPRHVWVVCGVVILGMMMSILDTTIVNVALDTLSKDLHSPLSQVQWVITGYLLSLAAVIPVTGWAARRFGAKQVYLVSLVLFTAGSALCGLAGSLTSLVVFRVLQGAGGGMIMPVAMMIMAQVAGPQQMGKVMGIVSMPAMIAPILGPVVGGLILQNLHWSWIFFVNVPIGAIAFALGWRMLPRTNPGEAERLDLVGLALLPAGCAALIYGISELGSGEAFGSGKVIVPAVAGLALIVLFCLHALRVERPLLDIRMYSNRVFAGAAFVNFGLGAALFGAMILVPLLLPGGARAGRDQHRAAHRAAGDRGAGGDAAGEPPDRTLRRRARGAHGRFGSVPQHDPAHVHRRAHLDRGDLGGAGRARPQHRAVLHAGDDRRVRVDAPRAGLRRDAAAHRAAAHRRGDRHGGARRRAAARRRGRPHGEARASAFDTAYWWALGIAALTLIPCTMLLRAERPTGRAGEERVVDAESAAAHTERAAEPVGV